MSEELTSQMLSSADNNPTSTFNLKVVAASTSLHSYARNYLIGVFPQVNWQQVPVP